MSASNPKFKYCANCNCLFVNAQAGAAFQFARTKRKSGSFHMWKMLPHFRLTTLLPCRLQLPRAITRVDTLLKLLNSKVNSKAKSLKIKLKRGNIVKLQRTGHNFENSSNLKLSTYFLSSNCRRGVKNCQVNIVTVKRNKKAITLSIGLLMCVKYLQ